MAQLNGTLPAYRGTVGGLYLNVSESATSSVASSAVAAPIAPSIGTTSTAIMPANTVTTVLVPAGNQSQVTTGVSALTQTRYQQAGWFTYTDTVGGVPTEFARITIPPPASAGNWVVLVRYRVVGRIGDGTSAGVQPVLLGPIGGLQAAVGISGGNSGPPGTGGSYVEARNQAVRKNAGVIALYGAGSTDYYDQDLGLAGTAVSFAFVNGGGLASDAIIMRIVRPASTFAGEFRWEIDVIGSPAVQ